MLFPSGRSTTMFAPLLLMLLSPCFLWLVGVGSEAGEEAVVVPSNPLLTIPPDDSANNSTLVIVNGTVVPPTNPEPPKVAVLPDSDSEEKEHKNSMAIFFILFVLVLSILLVHVLLVTKYDYIPESLAIVILGALVGFILKFSNQDWSQEEALSPNVFFLVLLPPIIFEGGYNLHKGNFFANLGSIMVFAIFGTMISALIVGGGIYILGQADLVYELSAIESFAFGSMISAVDPVATLAIFQAIKVEPVLYMLVFGESMLNDAVSIVLTTTILELDTPENAKLSVSEALLAAVGRFNLVFFASAGIGVATGLISALLLKCVDLRKTPSLEFAIMLIFAYLPYGLSEGLHLSGIMGILFCGLTMSHYTHFNLSPMTQITMQQTFRTLAFLGETCVFAYLGMAFFTFPLVFKPVFIVWAVILCLLGRAFNIFPLSYLMNIFRERKITKKMQFIMWFSGLRGAVAFALSLHVAFEGQQTRRVMITNTLSIVLFTILILGGGTLPLVKLLERWQNQEQESIAQNRRKRRRRRRRRERRRGQEKDGSFTLSKTQGLGPIEAECSYSDYTTDDGLMRGERGGGVEGGEAVGRMIFHKLKGLVDIDARYIRPFFVRKFTQQEKKESTLKLTDMALEWYQGVEEEEGSDEEATFSNATGTLAAAPLLPSPSPTHSHSPSPTAPLV